MPAYAWLVVAPVIGLAGFVALHFLLAWATGGKRAYGCVLQAFVGGFLVTAAASLAAVFSMEDKWNDRVALLLFNLVIFGALGFGYINFVGLSIASLRIRVLQELLGSPQGLTRDELIERYNPRVLIGNRISRLTGGGQIIRREGRFFSGKAGVLWIARTINLTKWVVLGKKKPKSKQKDEPGSV